MNDSQIKNRIQKLREEISRLRFLYHVEDAPDITDDVYDSLIKELKLLLEQYPEFIDPNSPENRVGGEPLDKFEKIKHEIKMFSIGNVFSKEEFFAWEKRNLKLLPDDTSLDYFCELKLDGLAISLVYENGKFIRGVTRGDGNVGENITSNLKMIESIPLILKPPFPPKIEVRGEAIMNKSILRKLNKKNEKENKPLFANSRNAAAGSLRQLNPKIMKERKLDFFAYEIAQIKGENWQKYIEKHSLKHELLNKLGFIVENHSRIIQDSERIFDFIEIISSKRDDLPIGIDGVVINIDDTEIFEKLGVTGKDPRGIIAYKYPAERATTIVTDITVNVGRTGVLTPVAHFNPTFVAGSTVSKATLHNMDQINRLDIRIGDTVVIQKAGDVIPEVVEVLFKMRTGKEKKFKIPENCPVCNFKVEKKEAGIQRSSSSLHSHVRAGLSNSSKSTNISLLGNFSARPSRPAQVFSRNNSSPAQESVAYYCTNKNCPARSSRGLQHFVNVFEIYEIGPKILDRLKDEGLISDSADLFTLEKADLSGLERFGEKSADNIISSIKSHKKVLLWRFIYALGIIHVGEQTARDLADHFGSLNKLMKADIEEINNLENIGPIVSQSIFDFFRDKLNLSFINKLLKNGISIYHEKAKNLKLSGKTFVLTGTLSTMSREEAKKRIIENGGSVASSVSSNISYVVAGDKPGSKYTEAKKLGVKILSEQEFLKIL
ncbi:MAG: NAD-dependent DNA ligase LigA [Candidatus Paceibacterota bacterium]